MRCGALELDGAGQREQVRIAAIKHGRLPDCLLEVVNSTWAWLSIEEWMESPFRDFYSNIVKMISQLSHR